LVGQRGGSSEVEVESVLHGRGRARAPWSGEAEVVRQRPGRSPSPGSGEAEFVVFRGLSLSPSPGSGGAEFAVFRGLSPSPSPGSGGAEFAVFRGLSPSPNPGSSGAEFAVFRGLARVRALGRAERSFLWRLWQGLTACQSHPVKWHCSRSGAGSAVLLSDRSVERRSDGGHFGPAGARASG
jgi:hypothetical protein